MKKLAAVFLAPVGLVVAVGLPVMLADWLKVDPGKQPAFLVGTMAPGVGLIVLAVKLWRAGPPPADPDAAAIGEEVSPVGRTCDRCRAVVADAGDGPPTPWAGSGFVCDACTEYRNRRAAVVLVLIFGSAGSCIGLSMVFGK